MVVLGGWALSYERGTSVCTERVGKFVCTGIQPAPLTPPPYPRSAAAKNPRAAIIWSDNSAALKVEKAYGIYMYLQGYLAHEKAPPPSGPP